MYLIEQKSSRFGAHDVLACKLCHGQMLLTRRSPHPKLGDKYELQRFTCQQCHHEASRSVDADGNALLEYPN
ncbi:hypothetical protein DW352_18320 [Pseudolabrys taiwanensis]|uniref:Uncharacterized protein n=1 Tax=Pseudolabrys taiwanensis TaxID=331696 RepID=A0A345ZZF6_9HYPH|nr:hypothetical protein DW352_18320 [Pseudolabrys taiwanensis]